MSQLVRAGFPVPGGFLVSTRAYREFVQANGLDEQIPAILQGNNNPGNLEAATARIRALFSTGSISGDLMNDLREASDHSSERAVAVQAMVQSQASGVLFTANPIAGLRSEMVIDATVGLGEALVSGQVKPDHYVVDSTTMQILTKTLGSKTVSIHGRDRGGMQSRSRIAAKCRSYPTSKS